MAAMRFLLPPMRRQRTIITMPLLLLLLLLFEDVANSWGAAVGSSNAVAASTGDNTMTRPLAPPSEHEQQQQQAIAGPRGLNLVKRAPNGFIGMRGKKEYEDGEGGIGGYWDLTPRETAAVVAEERWKKSPSSFYGVRGKKNTETDNSNENENENQNENVGGVDEISEPARRLRTAALRLALEEYWREQLLHELLDRVAATQMASNELQKRIPLGFSGMRGMGQTTNSDVDRDNDDDGTDHGLDYDFGYATDNRQQSALHGDDAAAVKRTPTNGFMGLRGKKSQNDEERDVVKRSPGESFSGFRSGSRQRTLADFNNKFVAVRGKKSRRFSPEDLKAAAAFLEQSPSGLFSMGGMARSNARASEGGAIDYHPAVSGAPHERYLVGMVPSSFFYGSGGKRAPSGFLGMRGKRSTTEEHVSPPSSVTSDLAQAHLRTMKEEDEEKQDKE